MESPGEEGRGGAGAGAGKRSDPSREGGGGGDDWRPRHRRRSFCEVAGGNPGASPGLSRPTRPTPPGRRESPASREGERRGALRVTAVRRKSPDKGKPRPLPPGQAPECLPPSQGSEPSPRDSEPRRGAPASPSQLALARATRGPICRQGRAGCRGLPASLWAPGMPTKGCPSPSSVTFSWPPC